MATDFGRLTVVELRAELKRRNLPQTGKKADLVDRLMTFERDQTPADNTADNNHHEAPDSTHRQSPADSRLVDISVNPAQDSSADDARRPSTAEDVTQAAAPQRAPDPTSAVGTEPPQPDEDSETSPQDRVVEIEATIATEAAAPEAATTTEIVKDSVSRKRRSRSPPPENESARKRSRPTSETDPKDVSEPDEGAQQQRDGLVAKKAVRESTHQELPAEPEPETPSRTAEDTNAPFQEPYRSDQEGRHTPSETHGWDQKRELSSSNPREKEIDTPAQPLNVSDRDVEPARHPATPALYIKNFMRPLREQVLRDFLVELAAFPGAAPDPDCLVDFHLDQIRTHAFVRFSSISAASRVRTALHGTVWPNERNRKELWVDFIPEDKVAEWIGREQSEGGRGSSSRWEVHYEPDYDGKITATLVNAEMEPIRRNSTRQPPPPPPAPTGPARNYPGVEGAPLGPRGRGANHYRQAPPPPASTTTGGRDYKVTRADPPLQYTPVPAELAQRRLDNMNAHITRDRHRDLGRPDEINRYTFENGDEFVDRGKEAFIGIRPPHRERERRRLGIGRGNRAPPPARRRTPSPRRPVRDDDGYRGGRDDHRYRDRGDDRRDDYERYRDRDRDDDRRDRRDDRDRYRDEPPRSRFDGQPLPTYSGGGGRGGRRGGGWRDRY